MLASARQIWNVNDPDKKGLLSSFSSKGYGRLPTLINGDGLNLDLRFVGPGAGRPWSDVDIAAAVDANGLRVAIGPYDAPNIAFCDEFTLVAITPIAIAPSIVGGAGANAVQVITLGEDAYDGTYSLTLELPNVVTADGTGTTIRGFTLAVSAKAEEIETLLLTHPEAVDGGKNGIRVTGNPGGPFAVSFINHLGLQPIATITADGVNLILPKRYQGRLSLATEELRDLFAAANADFITLRYEIEIQFPGQDPETPVEVPIKIGKQIIISGDPLPVGLSPQRGRSAIADAAEYRDIVFSPAFAGAPILAGTPCVEKGDAADLDVFCTGISGLTSAGFRAHLSAATTNANYQLHWLAYKP